MHLLLIPKFGGSAKTKIILKHINLVRALPICGVLAGAVYTAGSEISRSQAGDFAAGSLGVIVPGIFCIQIRLGRLPWFKKKDGKAHDFVLWLENIFPWLRGPNK
jgi:hypothetical protein